MKECVWAIYFSPTGGTKKAALYLAEGLGKEVKEVDLSAPDFNGAEFKKDDLVIVAAPAFGGRIPALMAERLKCTAGKGAAAVTAAVYGNRAYEDVLVDNCAMQLVMNPGQFDVILTENMFGDILSDEASMITGSIGMLSSASLNETRFGLYEPSHGSAPDIAGKDLANPIATILSAAMMLRYSFDLDQEADAVEEAVRQVLEDGYRTGDIMAEGCKKVGTREMGDQIAARICRTEA